MTKQHSKSNDDFHWNYSDEHPNGPRNWPKHFRTGNLQSPINIQVDFCDVHKSSCGCLALDSKLENMLNLTQRSNEQLYATPKVRNREHLDSTGNETPDLDQDEICRRGERRRRDNERPSSSCSSTTSTGSGSIESGLSTSERNSPIGCKITQSVQNTRYCVTNKKLFLGYPRYLNKITLTNTGHAWQVDIDADLASHTLLSGPSLGDREYRLAQLHCHWGDHNQHGSEHQVNGRSYSAEIHFVHWNCTQFKSFEEASKQRHGLAVLAVFLQALDGEQNNNKHLDRILASGLAQIRDKPHSSITLDNSRLDLKKLFPTNRWNYATYEGSLTTPPLSEVVDWIVFLTPVQCSTRQIDQFRRIKCPQGDLVKNCRPVQPANNRIVSIWTHAHH